MRYNIQWRNKYSGESGYVSKVIYDAGHFVNSYVQEEAKKYSSAAEAERDINSLFEMGEGDSNYFCIVGQQE